MEAETQAKVWAAATGHEVVQYPLPDYRFPDSELCWVYLHGIDATPIPDLLSWAGCGALLDAMRAKGWYVLIFPHVAHTTPPANSTELPAPYARLSVKFVYWPDMDGSGLLNDGAEAPTLPLAVATAAAAALGVEVRRA